MLARRWLATVIDYPIVFGVLLAADSALGNEVYQRTLWIWLPLALLYLPVCEARWGRTVGKLVAGVVIVREDGTAPGARKAVVRCVLRLVELNPVLLGGIPALVAYLSTPHHQRLGDLAAGTFVLTRSDRAALRGARTGTPTGDAGP